MPPTTLSQNRPLKRENASTANVLMCKQWWKVCWMYGDQEKYYRQLYGKPKGFEGQKSFFDTPTEYQNNDKPVRPPKQLNNTPKQKNPPDWAIQYYQTTRLLDDTPPLPNVGHTNSSNIGVPVASDCSANGSVGQNEKALNRSFSFEEVRVSSPNGERHWSTTLNGLDLTKRNYEE